jgi:hypothetical protein
MWGRYLVLDCSSCNRAAVRDPDTIRDVCTNLVSSVGVISASWVWFLMIGLGASFLQQWLTSPVRLWIQRGSGVLMLGLAGILAFELTWGTACPC